ncbi:DUF523 domain-containing protein [Gilvimarinus sp. F26214L]|uniref:DUF523 domain-containing protein n=1 Tax=Gilvimarinus sp. DZF01 TaxID=3461371 RepID=UPI0040464764
MNDQHRAIVIGLSACLSGSPVRYDGTDKRQDLVLDTLGAHAQLASVCPELEAGLGVPRPPVELIATSTGVRALGVDNVSLDVTEALVVTADRYVANQSDALSGFIFKSRSPSCGSGSTPVRYADGRTELDSGLFARALQSSAPWLACVEETQLQNELQCFRFLTACCAVNRERHGDRSHDDLLDWLHTELGTEGRDLVLRDLLLNADPDNKKAALGERLLRYWKRK